MCGFAGYYSSDLNLFESKAERILKDMSSALVHRGPDGVGHWVDGSKGIALTHRRLAIVDLSANGAQPMLSASKRYTLVLNGEIYNHLELRKKLELAAGGLIEWRGNSDTESLLMFFEYWGIEKALTLSKGMFAFAVLDCKNNELFLGRDRFGEKPLYYGWQENRCERAFVFASELSAIKQHPAFENTIDRTSLSSFVKYKSITGDRSIFVGLKKLLPGSLLRFSLTKQDYDIKKWWSVSENYEIARSSKFSPDRNDVLLNLEDVLTRSITSQMQADVPLGAFLSGGVDSSLIVALMQKQQTSKIKTFSIGFNERSFNEAVYAKEVAEHLNTDHTELYVSATDALKIVPELPKIYSEPFADASQIPTYLVSKLASQSVTVALSGDAGDELFCGYNRYKYTEKLWKIFSKAPLKIRGRFARIFQSLNPVVLNQLGKMVDRNLLGDKVLKGSLLLDSENLSVLYDRLISDWTKSDSIVVGIPPQRNNEAELSSLSRHVDSIEEMMLADIESYLVDDILVKVDRAAMANSLETRIPFLDHEVAKFAWSLPLNLKLHNGVTKWPLRQILYKYIPIGLVDRPKMGFGVPIDQWLRGPLKEWAEELLEPSRLTKEAFFDADQVSKAWLEHKTGKRNWQGRLWNILMFQAWLEHHNKNFDHK